MKKPIIILITILLGTLCSETAYSQNSSKSAIKQINSYVEKIDLAIKSKKEPDLVFADVSQNNKSKWRKFSSTKSLEKYREEKSETYSISNNWLNNGKIVVSIFTLFSESGDWANYVSYYYRQMEV